MQPHESQAVLQFWILISTCIPNFIARMQSELSFPEGQIIRLAFTRAVHGGFDCNLFHRSSKAETAHIAALPRWNHDTKTSEQTVYIDGIKRNVSAHLYDLLEAQWKDDSVAQTLYFHTEDFYSHAGLFKNTGYVPLSAETSIRLFF
jgi:hypothetical protein